MSEPLTLGQWIVVLVGSGAVPFVAIVAIVVMEYMSKKPTPKKKKGEWRVKR